MIVELEIPGDPVPWARAGKHGKRHFTKAPQARHMRAIQKAWQAAGCPRLPDEGLTLSAQFYLERPKTHLGTGRNAGRLKPSAPPAPLGLPDTSNLLKLVEDALNELLWRDDSLIVCLSGVNKLYARPGEPGRTVIKAWPAGPLFHL